MTQLQHLYNTAIQFISCEPQHSTQNSLMQNEGCTWHPPWFRSHIQSLWLPWELDIASTLLASLPFHPPECMLWWAFVLRTTYVICTHPINLLAVFAVFLISLVFVELCLSTGISVHISLQSRPGRHAIFQFMVQLNTGWFTKMLKNMERLGGQAKTLSNLGILKIKLTFCLGGLSNFNIHSLLHKDKGSLSTT